MKVIQEQPRILIVEDDAVHADLMAESISDYFPKATVDIVERGSQCLASRLEQYDVILLDYGIPDTDGVTLLKQIHERCSVPVIMVTGQREGKIVVDAIDGGAADFVIKSPDCFVILPVIIRKTLALENIRRQNRQLTEELRVSNRSIREKNAMLKKSLAKQRRMAASDPLTGLYNRRHFKRVLDVLFTQARRYDNDLACIMVDLDDYKNINDSLGHLMGDELLCLAAKILQEQCRASDVIARYGGDEFVILLPHADSAQAADVSQRIASAFRQQADSKTLPLAQTSMSMGVASLRENQLETPDRLVASADKAMYQAKEQGKCCIVVFGQKNKLQAAPAV